MIETKLTEENILQKMETDRAMAQSTHDSMMSTVDAWRFEVYGKYAAPADSNNPSAQNMKSHTVMKDLMRIVESSIPALSEPFVSNSDIVGIQAKNAETVQKAAVLEQLINYQFRSGMDAITFIEDIARDLQVEGTVFIKSGWHEDSPTAELVMLNELIIDPAARSLNDAKFVVQRTKVSISDVIANPGWYGEHDVSELFALTGTASSTNSEYDDNWKEGLGRDDSFNYADEARQLIDVMEYYGSLDLDGSGVLTPIIGIWAGEMLLNFQASPYPEEWNGIPFSSGVYTRDSHNIYGRGISDLVGDYQKIRTGFMRAIVDNANRANHAQVAVKKGFLDVANKRKMINGEDFETLGDPTTGMTFGQFNEVPSSVFNLIEMFKVEEEELSGISRNNAGFDGRSINNTTATAANIVQSNAERRLLQITRHMGSLLEDVFSKWIDLNKMMLRQGMVKVKPQIAQQMGGRGMNAGNGLMAMDVNGGMLQGNFDVAIQVGTAGQKTAQNENIMLMMQQMIPLQQQMGPKVQFELLAKLADNLDMPGLSRDLLDQANPDEQQVQAQQQKQQQQQQMNQKVQMVQIQSELQAQEASTQKDYASAQKMQSEAVQNNIETEVIAMGG